VVTMSCGCGCCPKCGCRATCTCNNTLWSLESRSDFSYLESPVKPVADEYEEQYSFNGDMEWSSQADFTGAEGAYAKKGSRGIDNYKADYGHTE